MVGLRIPRNTSQSKGAILVLVLVFITHFFGDRIE